MSGQAFTPRRLLPYALVALTMLTIPSVGGASGSHRATAALRARQSSLARQSRSAALDLYALDHRLAAARARLSGIARTEASLRAQRTALTRQLAIAQRSSRAAQRILRGRLRALYEQGDVEPLEILLGSRNLEEAMTSIDDLDAAAASNQELVQRLAQARAQLVATRRAIVARESALARAHAAARATAAGLERAHVARAAFLASLASTRRLTARAIQSVVAEAHAAQARSLRLQPGPRGAPGKTLTVSTTGYSLGGRTSSGLAVGVGVAAVDPSVIPLGTHMSIPGYGDAVAADTGSSIRGARVDLWFPTLAKARAWGRRTVTITLR